MKKWGRLIVALDLEEERKIKQAVELLSSKVKKFKIGPIAFLPWGQRIIKYVHIQNKEVFLDLKFYDIPNTMAKAARAAAKMGIWAFTVHLAAGKDALTFLAQDLKRYCRSCKIRRPKIIGVSELTSKKASLKSVMRLVEVAALAKLDGVVCSAQEVSQVKKHFPSLLAITPGIRKEKTDDQKRIATASFAFSRGADYIVVGRPIIAEKDLLAAASDILSS